jgi:outer membrane protein OmpA-like peptidoglycan-associated protein
MAEDKAPTDWAADVKRYVPDADDGVIAKIVSYCGIALRTRDASMVSFTDPKETDRVRENFCKKKLALEDSDDVLDAAIAAVGKRMSDTNYRNRVTVYYLLAEHFGKLSVFGGTAAAATVVSLAAAASTAASAAAPVTAPAPPAAPAAAPAAEDVVPSASAAAAPAAAPPVAPAPAASVVPQALSAAAAAKTGPAAGGAGGGGFLGLAALVFGGAATIMLVSAIAGSFVAGRFDKEAPPPPPAAPAAPVAAPAPVTPPEGAGIISEVVEGRPKVSVYFAVGKNDIAPDFTAAVAPVKAWLEANPTDRVQLSGFTDPTGDAAANAELAKNRAQAVQAALTGEGVAEDRIDLVKPDDTSDEASDLAGARRVEITVTPG